MLENAAAAIKRKIEDRLLPSLEDAAQSALDSLLTLHGPLMLATGEGRELQEQADRLRMTREEQLRLRGDAEILALELLQSPELIEPGVADTVVQAVQAIGNGRFPERGTVFGFVTIKNVAIVLVSGAALAAFLPAGVALGGTLGGAATAGLAWVGYESLKKSKIFTAATAALAERFDQVVGGGEAKLAQRLASLAPFKRFVGANEDALRRIATNTRQLRWMLPYIDFIVPRNETKAVAPPSGELGADDRSRVQSVCFNYSEHDGYMIVGEGDVAFTLQFSKSSDSQIHFIRARENTEIARANGVSRGQVIGFDQFPHTSTRYTLLVGEHFIVKNENGYFMQGHIIGITDDTRGAATDEVCFEYQIYLDRRSEFRVL
jgi:hypothetical protein